jgi:hypothetical protein
MSRTPSARRSSIGARIAVIAAAATVLAVVGPSPAIEAQPAPTTTTSSLDPGPSSTTTLTTRSITTRTQTTTIGHCCISAEFFPTSNLTDGSVVNVTLRASGNAYFNDPIPIQICKSETGQCPDAEPPSPTADATISFRPPSRQGTFTVPFRIGTGTFRTTISGNLYTFVCGPGDPCALQVRFGSQYGTVPITRSTGLTYTGTPVTTTTTTTRPAHVLCAYRDRVPPWLWALLVSLFDIAC